MQHKKQVGHQRHATIIMFPLKCAKLCGSWNSFISPTPLLSLTPHSNFYGNISLRHFLREHSLTSFVLRAVLLASLLIIYVKQVRCNAIYIYYKFVAFLTLSSLSLPLLSSSTTSCELLSQFSTCSG